MKCKDLIERNHNSLIIHPPLSTIIFLSPLFVLALFIASIILFSGCSSIYPIINAEESDKKLQIQSANEFRENKIKRQKALLATPIPTSPPKTKFSGVVENVIYQYVIGDRTTYWIATVYFNDGRIIRFYIFESIHIFKKKRYTEITYRKCRDDDLTKSAMDIYVLDDIQIFDKSLKPEKE